MKTKAKNIRANIFEIKLFLNLGPRKLNQDTMATRAPDDYRRKWDKKEYERKALDRIQKIGAKDDPALEAPRELLKTREL
jgi:hypothetical protein